MCVCVCSVWVLCSFVLYVLADMHASMCMCLWVAGCFLQSFSTHLKLYLFSYLLKFFSFVCSFTCSDQVTTWGSQFLLSILWSSWGCLGDVLGINSDGEVWQQAPVLSELPHWPSTLCLETGSLTEPNDWIGGPASSRNLLLVTSSSALGVHRVMLSYFHGCWRSNSGPHAGVAAHYWLSQIPSPLSGFICT